MYIYIYKNDYYLFADATRFDTLYASVFHQLVCEMFNLCVCVTRDVIPWFI